MAKNVILALLLVLSLASADLMKSYHGGLYGMILHLQADQYNTASETKYSATVLSKAGGRNMMRIGTLGTTNNVGVVISGPKWTPEFGVSVNQFLCGDTHIGFPPHYQNLGSAWRILSSQIIQHLGFTRFPAGLQIGHYHHTRPYIQPLKEYLEADISNSFSGPWASPSALTLRFARVGRIVTMNIPALNTTSSSSSIATAANAIPSEFLPIRDIGFSIPIINDSQTTIGLLLINTTGHMTISTVSNNAFDSSGSAGWTDFEVGWIAEE